jgi:hypothetical protein
MKNRKRSTPQTPRPTPQQRKEAFLREYSRLGTILKAAPAAGIDRKSHYLWFKADPEYAELFERAKEDYLEKLEAEADRRAVEGTLRPVFYEGEECGHIREFSDVLLIFRLKSLAPEKYRENRKIDVNVSGAEDFYRDIQESKRR